MNLDDLTSINSIDSSSLIQFIRNIPEDIFTAWQAGRAYKQRDAVNISRIILCGSGSSLITSRLLASYINMTSSIPVSVNDGVKLPEWACDKQTLIVVISVTGNEPEINLLLSQCSGKSCNLIVISPAGQIQETADKSGYSYLPLIYSGPARLLFSYSFFIPLGILASMGLAREEEIADLIIELKRTRDQIEISIPITSNPAKRLAGQFMNRLVTLFASGAMVDVAHLWKAQINENAKAWVQVEEINIASRLTIGGMCSPEAQLSQMMTIFLETPFDEPVYLAASGKLRELFMVEGFNTDYYAPSGNSPLKSIWNAIIYGLYVSYYLAIAYGIDPLPNPGIEEMDYFLSEL